MKLILELTKEDIHPVFKECYPNQMKPHQMESMHFYDRIRGMWNQMDEIYFLQEINCIQQIIEESPRRIRLK